MNSVQVIGNLVRDPQVRMTNTGKAVASFTVAVSNKYSTQQGEKETTDYVGCTVWGKQAEAVGSNLHKGSRVYVTGRFTTRSYQDKQGQKRWISEVNVSFVGIPLSNNEWGRGESQGDFSQFGTAEDIPF